MSSTSSFPDDKHKPLTSEITIDPEDRPSGPIIVLPSPVMKRQRIGVRSASPHSSINASPMSVSSTSSLCPSIIDELVLDGDENSPVDNRPRIMTADAASEVLFASNIVPRERAKVPLSPNRGHMSWIQYKESLPFPTLRTVTVKELAEHNTPDDCWVAIQGRVYDVTDYIPYHPGGADPLLSVAGGDATADFMDIHGFVNFALMLEKHQIGKLEGKSTN